MPAPSEHFAARRALSRARMRRRRLAAIGGLIVLVVALVAVLLGTGRSSPKQSGSGAPAAAAPHGGGGHAARHGSASVPSSAESASMRRLAGFGRPIYCAGDHGDAVAFTFDDGPGPYTHLAIRKLRAAHERATFFAVGRSIDNFPGYLHRELALGTIGDHTYTHPLLTALPEATVESEISRTAHRIQSEAGERVALFRPPYGARNATVDQVARRLGLLEILWNVDSADSLGANYAGITQNVEAGLHPGSIILMHENRGQTIRALTALLPELHRRHLRSVSLPELLSTDPPSARQLSLGPAGCASRVIHGSGA